MQAAQRILAIPLHFSGLMKTGARYLPNLDSITYQLNGKDMGRNNNTLIVVTNTFWNIGNEENQYIQCFSSCPIYFHVCMYV